MDEKAPSVLDAPQIDSLGATVGSARLSGRSALLDRARRLEQEAAGLRRLAAILPGEMPAQADEALWRLVMAIRY